VASPRRGGAAAAGGARGGAAAAGGAVKDLDRDGRRGEEASVPWGVLRVRRAFVVGYLTFYHYNGGYLLGYILPVDTTFLVHERENTYKFTIIAHVARQPCCPARI
jgi:hypothetical protein